MTDKRKRIGTLVEVTTSGVKHNAYIPKPLPLDPPLDMEGMSDLIDKATSSLGQLNAIRTILPDPDILLTLHGMREALVSSQIEGTQSTMSDLLEPATPNQENQEVLRYTEALDYGTKKIKNNDPISLRLIKEIHHILMKGQTKHLPGEFRSSSNRIGGTNFNEATLVPPPHEKIMETLDNLEKFIHQKKSLPILVKAALVHAQFETIHPFLDGNGRVGRILIILMLYAKATIKEPILFLSIYFKKNRSRYYSHLKMTHQYGDWEEWVKFFLQGVVETSNETFESVNKIVRLFQEDEKKIIKQSNSANVLTVHNRLKKNPIIITRDIREICKISPNGATQITKKLVQMGILQERGEKKYNNKRFVYSEYFNILNKDTEPLPP